MEISGRKTAAAGAVHRENPPLIVAVHGGGYTSEYFDAGEYSLLDRAAAAGVPSIAIDRPGYGASTALPHGDRAVPRNAEVLQSAIAKLWNERDHDAAGIVIVGHSIGSTTSLYLASQPTDWPLLGVA
jgi:pimeloyl-ACP methyl ester carboxylesterase